MRSQPAVPVPQAGSLAQNDFLLCGLLLLAALLAYANTFNAPFVFDDRAAILDNPTIRDLSRLDQVFSPPVDGRAVAGRPFINFTFAINYAWSGFAPWSYHLVNLLIHALGGILLWQILRRCLPAPALAWWVALLWTLHPLQTESVTCVVQRTESLGGFFVLLTLFTFIRAAESAPTHSRGWLALSVVACLTGMATKEIMATVPLLLYLYDRTFMAGSFAAAWARRRGWYLALASTWGLLALLVLRSGGTRGSAAGFSSGITSWAYLQSQAGAIVHYLRLVVWPHPLVVDYGPAVPVALSEVWWQGIVVLALMVSTGWALVRQPKVGFAGAWCFIILAPSSSFIPLAAQPIAEHRMYLPLAAILALGAAVAFLRLGRRAVPVLAVLGLVAGVVTWQRNQVYRSELTLWTDTVARAPANPRALSNLGAALLDAGRTGEAAAVFERAVAILPNSPEILSNLCNAYAGLGRFAAAIAYGEKVLLLVPGDADARINLSRACYLSGNASVASRDFPAALAAYRRALPYDPDNVALRNNLANVLLVLGQWDEAIAEYGHVLRARPDDRSVRDNLNRAIELKAGR